MAKQDQDNKRLLEELKQQKRQLMMKQSKYTPTPPTAESSQAANSVFASVNPHGQPSVPPQAVAMLRTAEAQSYGSFVPTNSWLGNSLIPVIPRLEAPASPAPPVSTATLPLN